MAGVRIVFAFYPLYVTYNHGIALLSALCKKAGFDTALYVLDEVKKFKDYLATSEAPTVGFSCVTQHDYDLSFPFMQAAKDAGKEVLLGGVYPRRVKSLAAPADWICHGQGENLPYYFFNPAYDFAFRPERETFPPLNDLPLPDYDLFAPYSFDRDFPFARGKKILPYHSARGCPFLCSFCEVRTQPRQLRVRTKVKEDLTYITGKYRPDIIYIADELAPVYYGGWRNSWEDFKFPFIAYIRGDWHEDILRWLINKGMVGAMFGVESGNEQYRNEVLKKDLMDREVWKTIAILSKAGVDYGAFFMTGTPGETFRLRLETQQMADKIKQAGGFVVTYQFEDIFNTGGE